MDVIASSAEDWLGLKEVLVGHCADAGRSPDEITCSVNVRLDTEAELAKNIDLALESVVAYRDAGVDLLIMNLPHRAKPGILEPLAAALAPLSTS